MIKIFDNEHPDQFSFNFLMVFVMFITVISSCTETVPLCDDKKTVKAVRAEAMEILLDDISSVASLGGGELSEDERKMFKASMSVNVDNIRQKSVDENKNEYSCAADLTVRSAGGVESMPVTYISTVRDGNVQVTVSGLE